MMNWKKMLFAALALFLIVAESCSKKDMVYTPPTTTNTTELLLDSIFYYAKQTYYWYNQLPNYQTFNPRSYNTGSGSDADKATKEIFALTRYATNSSTGKSYEYNTIYPTETKYSYLYLEDATNGSTSNVKSSVIDGTSNDLGFVPGFWTSDSIYARYVITNSPAYNAGLRRGDRIVKFDGRVIDINNSADSAYLTNLLNSGTNTTLTVTNDGVDTTRDITITKAAYNPSPIYRDTTIVRGSKVIGYFAMMNFMNLNKAQTYLDAVFTKFQNDNITDLVVDLRHNGGGYVETSEYLVNKLIPTGNDGSIMFREKYNTLMQNNQATILKNQPLVYSDGTIHGTYFDLNYNLDDNNTNVVSKLKKAGGPTSLGNLIFIVDGYTASASELTINSLKPYFSASKIQLVGAAFDIHANYTYGKPVGFFAIHLAQKYDLYISQFASYNANNQGDYYSGLATNYESIDNIRYNWGNPKETAFAQAISYIVGNGYLTAINNAAFSTSTKSGTTTPLLNHRAVAMPGYSTNMIQRMK